MTEAFIRALIVKWAKWGAAHEAAIHYAQIRPIPVRDKPGTLPLRTDCSGFATLCYKWSGAPDPNGNKYSGAGYTGTLLAHMQHVARSSAKPGDLVVFGAAPGHHVVILLENGSRPDPLVCSHGQEKGPLICKLSEEAKYQPKPLTFLRGKYPVPVAGNGAATLPPAKCSDVTCICGGGGTTKAV